MLRRLSARATLALVLVLTGLGLTLGVTATPASAASTDCPAVLVNFYDYHPASNVTNSNAILLDPYIVGCDAPYEGYNTTCLTVRLVVYSRPGQGILNTLGPWVRSCWTPKPLASGFGGWVRRGDTVYLQARDQQDGKHYAQGELLT